MRTLRRIACLTALALVVALPATSALAAPAVTVKVAKHKGGPFTEDVEQVNITAPKTLYFKALSNGGGQHDATLIHGSCCAGVHDFKVHYFRKHNNITSDVRGSGFDFPLAIGNPWTFRIRVEPKVANPDQYCLFPHVSIDASAVEFRGYFAINSPGACA